MKRSSSANALEVVKGELIARGAPLPLLQFWLLQFLNPKFLEAEVNRFRKNTKFITIYYTCLVPADDPEGTRHG